MRRHLEYVGSDSDTEQSGKSTQLDNTEISTEREGRSSETAREDTGDEQEKESVEVDGEDTEDNNDSVASDLEGEETTELEESYRLQNTVAILHDIRLEARIEGELMSTELRNPEAMTPTMRIAFLKIIQRHEVNNQNLQNTLNVLISYYERMKLASNTERAGIQNDDYENKFLALTQEINAIGELTPNSNAGLIGETLDRASGTAVDGLSWALRGMDRLPPALQLGSFAVLGLMLYKSLRSGKILKGLLIGGVSLYTVSHGVRAFTGRRVSEWVDVLADADSRRYTLPYYAGYFDVNTDEAAEKTRLELLLESIFESSPFSERSFQEIFNNYSSATDRKMPRTLLYNSRLRSVSDPEELPEVMYESLKILFDKFGPDSELYEHNEEIRTQWDYIMENNVSYRQAVISLMSIDPDSPRLPVETFRERVNNNIEWVLESFNNLFAKETNSETKKANDSFSSKYRRIENAHSQEGINSWLNRSVNGLRSFLNNFNDEIMRRGVSSAFESESNIYESQEGIVYGGDEIELTTENCFNSEARMSLISQSLSRFVENLKTKYPDANTSNVEVLLGGATELNENGDGKYYLSFSWTPTDISSGLLNAEGLMSESIYAPENRRYTNYLVFRPSAYEISFIRAHYGLRTIEEAQEKLTELYENDKPNDPRSYLLLILRGERINEDVPDAFKSLLEINKNLAGTDETLLLRLNYIAAIIHNNPDIIERYGIDATYEEEGFAEKYRIEMQSLFNLDE